MKHFKIGVTDPAGRGGVGIMLSAVNWGGGFQEGIPWSVNKWALRTPTGMHLVD